MICRKHLAALVITAVVLPMVVVIVLGVSKLLAAMGDAAGELWLSRVALAASVLWLVDLVLLLVAVAIKVATEPED